VQYIGAGDGLITEGLTKVKIFDVNHPIPGFYIFIETVAIEASSTISISLTVGHPTMSYFY